MDSLEAMEHIERAFLTIDESEWLPQWSFDFWIIPYLMGKGVSREELKEFMRIANQLLRLEVATVDSRERAHLQRRSLRQLVDTVGTWNLVA
jgi:p-methyltransferase